ncbi:MAG: DUF4430 domain-containing protein [Clostridia bacterium]|nr:DUF4430 domain-containing protein [Clostridia bacterium]
MKRLWIKVCLSLLLVGGLLCSAVFGVAAADSNAVDKAQRFADGVLRYQMERSGASSVQQWINGALTSKAGQSAEWYIVSLSQIGHYDFSSYRRALRQYLETNTVYSATSRQKYALALMAADAGNDAYIDSTMNDSIGEQGVMSWIYGLHLLNNGRTSREHTAASVIQALLSLRTNDGGWAVIGTKGDVDVTAMALQALSPYYQSDAAVRSAVDRALSLLSSKQLADGDYAGYGSPNPESTAQVIVALSALHIDLASDTRFIKNGHTLLDGIERYRLANGGFCHTQNGEVNESATVQGYYAMIAYLRMASGKGGLYILDTARPTTRVTAQPTTRATTRPTTRATIRSTKATTRTTTRATIRTTTRVTIRATTRITTRAMTHAAAPATLYTAVSTTQFAGTTSMPITTWSTTASTVSHTMATTISTTAPTQTTVFDAAVITESTPVQTTTAQHSMASTFDGPSGVGRDDAYKPIACLVIEGLAIAALVLLWILGKRHPKNLIAVLVIAAILCGIVLLTNFQSPEAYYSKAEKANAIREVTIAIRCDTVAGKSDLAPADGVILPATVYSIAEGDTVYDVLTAAVKEHHLQMETSGSTGMIYVAGIQYLYEFDFGDLSGWMYDVNGETPSVGCDRYVLQPGDEIVWAYTCEIGNDLT